LAALALAMLGARTFSASVDDGLRCGVVGFVGGEDAALWVGVVFLGSDSGFFACCDEEASRVTSLLENMRVRRSFTEALSAGFDRGSSNPEGIAWPFWAIKFGDRVGKSTDLKDGAFEEAEAALASEEFAMVDCESAGGRNS